MRFLRKYFPFVNLKTIQIPVIHNQKNNIFYNTVYYQNGKFNDLKKNVDNFLEIIDNNTFWLEVEQKDAVYHYITNTTWESYRYSLLENFIYCFKAKLNKNRIFFHDVSLFLEKYIDIVEKEYDKEHAAELRRFYRKMIDVANEWMNYEKMDE